MKASRETVLLLAVATALAAPPAEGGIWERLKGAVGAATQAPGGSPQATDLAAAEIGQGLREALQVGTRQAVSRATAAGGFLDNPAIHIPLPGGLQRVSQLLSGFGMGGQLTAFEETLNRAAEKAAAGALPIFSETVTNLTFEDVQALWKGGESAATDYLRQHTGDRLYQAFRPVVAEATGQVGVAGAYRALTARPEIAGLVAGTQLDLDHYVTEGTLNGVFTLLAEEEKRIRTDPVARTTELLRRVFGP